MKYPVNVRLHHVTGKKVDGCHLRQDTEGVASFAFDPVGSTMWQTKEDYSSARSGGWETYHGWWYFDEPTVDEVFPTLPRAPQTFWWQAEVHVEEAPSVRTWYGHAATAFYGQGLDGADEGITRWRYEFRRSFSVAIGEFAK